MKDRIYGSVGKDGGNSINDVKLVQALLNVYLRRESKEFLTVSGRCDAETLMLIETFQKNEQKNLKPDGRIDANGGTFRALLSVRDRVLMDNQTLIKPSEGAVTFDSEGTEGGMYHSRILHVPSEASGLTLGRGYDMKEKIGTKVVMDLVKAGVNTNTAMIFSMASGKQGVTARQFIIDNDLLDFQITPLVQKKLFEVSYVDEVAEAERICTLERIEKQYGKCNWDKLDYRIKEIIVDLKFRGDYTESSRVHIQTHIANNDFDNFKKVIDDRSKWSSVPEDRFERRKKFLASAEKR